MGRGRGQCMCGLMGPGSGFLFDGFSRRSPFGGRRSLPQIPRWYRRVRLDASFSINVECCKTDAFWPRTSAAMGSQCRRRTRKSGRDDFERIFFCRPPESRQKRGRDQNPSIDSNLVVYHHPLAFAMSAHPKFSQVFRLLLLCSCVSLSFSCLVLRSRPLFSLGVRASFFQKFEFFRNFLSPPPALFRRPVAPPAHFRYLIVLVHSLRCLFTCCVSCLRVSLPPV